MKTNIILSILVAGAMSFTACTNKVDEKTISEINQFETEWTTLGEKASTWSADLNQTTVKAKEFAAQQASLVASMSTSKDQDLKTKVTEMADKANQDASKFESMENEWNTFKSTWDETTKQFTEWKDKVMKGQVNPDETSKGIAEFRTKMSDAQSRIDTWSNTYAETKSSCEQNMATAENITKNVQPVK